MGCFRWVRYRPFSKPHTGLFRVFADAKPTRDGVLDFANRFGMLGHPVTRTFWRGENVSPLPPAAFSPLDVDATLTDAGGFLGEYLELDSPENPWTWAAQIRLLSDFLWWSTTLADLPDVALVSLAEVANMAFAWTAAPSFLWSAADNTFRLSLRPRSLLGALWLQAARAIADPKMMFRACPVCHTPIEISRSGGPRSDAMFCSNACKSRDYRHLRKAEAQRLLEKKWRVFQIAKKVRTDAATVHKWLR